MLALATTAQGRRHSWERTSKTYRDGSDQPKIGDITGEAELAGRTQQRLPQRMVLKPISTALSTLSEMLRKMDVIPALDTLGAKAVPRYCPSVDRALPAYWVHQAAKRRYGGRRKGNDLLGERFKGADYRLQRIALVLIAVNQNWQ